MGFIIPENEVKVTDTTTQDDYQQDPITDDAGVEIDTDQTEGNEDDGDENPDDLDPEASQDDDSEEYEEDGVKYRVPKALKGHLLRNRDYTQKTQALAEKERAFEAERQQVKATDEEIETARFELKAGETRMQTLRNLSNQDWAELQTNYPADYDRLQREFLTLPRQLDEAKRKLDETSTKALEKQRQIDAKRLEEGYAELQRDIPGWGPDLGAKLVDFVRTEFGVTPERHAKAFEDPALVKMAHAAYAARQTKLKTQSQQRAEKAQITRPAHVAKSGAAPGGLSDRMSAKEWAEKRNAQLAAKGRR